MGQYFHQTIDRNIYNLAPHNKSFLIGSNRISNKKYKYYKNDYLTTSGTLLPTEEPVKPKIKRGLLHKEGKSTRPSRKPWNGLCLIN